MPSLQRGASLLALGLVPTAAALHVFTPERHTLIFAVSAAAIVPLAGYMGRATETLAAQLGSGIGGLLNATFGNATELIIGALGVRHGLTAVVKASLTGSIIGNILLVFGAAAVVGGIKHPVLRFNPTAARTGAAMLLLSATALIVPVVFHWLSRNTPGAPELKMDTEISVVLVITYALSMLFTLRTHRQAYDSSTKPHDARQTSIGRPLVTLLVATAAIGYMSELLVGTVSAAAQGLGLSQLFVGVIIVAFIGNAAEHYSAVSLAAQDNMDATVAIAIGSSTQIALFVAPVLVFLSY